MTYGKSSEALGMRARKTVSMKVEMRLASYAMAAAAAAGLAVAPSRASASVVYTPTSITLTGGTADIDLDGDGIADFTIVDRIIAVTFYSDRMLGVEGAGGAGVVESTNNKGAAVMHAGSSIGSLRRFQRVDVARANMASIGYTCSTQNGCVSFLKGPWKSQKNKYLGFKFNINGETHYGWARLNVKYSYHMGGHSKIEVYISGYAYETTPGTPILAGQTTAADSANTPGSLGNLARGTAK